MLARLILALLLAAFALPGAASACHDAPVAMAAMHHGPVHAPDKAVSVHACLGCIPLGDCAVARMEAPLLPVADAPLWMVATLDVRGAGPPALPPPRHG